MIFQIFVKDMTIIQIGITMGFQMVVMMMMMAMESMMKMINVLVLMIASIQMEMDFQMIVMQ